MEQLSRKQRYEARKQEKMQQLEEYRSQRKQRHFLTIGAVVIPAVILAALFGYIIFKAPKTSQPDIGQTFPDQGRQHIAEGATHPAYNSHPPTSGWHYAIWADWGVYKEELPQERLIHNLEHGGIVIQYKNPSSGQNLSDSASKPTLDKTIIAKLEDLKKSEYQCKIVVAPYSKLDKNIAITAWRHLYKTDTYEEATIKAFIDRYHDLGPEAVGCDVKATPMNPVTP